MTKEDRAAIMAIFTPALGEELAADIIAHRNGKKCPLTPRGARSLLREYEATGNAVAAAEEHLNRGWQGFKAEWIKQASRYTDQHNPTPRPSVNYGPAEIVPIPQPLSEEERARRAQMAARARQLVRGAIQ
jgi:hypothetical protein